MKVINTHVKPVTGTEQDVHITSKTWIVKLDFSIIYMDDFMMVLRMEFFN